MPRVPEIYEVSYLGWTAAEVSLLLVRSGFSNYPVEACVVCACVYSLLLVLGLRARGRVGAAHVEARVQLALVGRLQDLERAHQGLVHGH